MQVTESEAVRTRRLDFVRANGQWTINGTTWDDVVRSGFTKVLADPTRRRRRDLGAAQPLGRLAPPGAHPLHRLQGAQPQRRAAAAARASAPKDVVFLGENETVRVLIKFAGGRGKYMVHCHNLVHEDHDMMGQFEIRDAVDARPRPVRRPAQAAARG